MALARPRSLAALLLLMLVAPAGLAAHQAWGALPAQPAAIGGEAPDRIEVGFHGAVPADLGAWLAAQGGQVEHRSKLGWASAVFPDAARADAALAAARARPDVAWAQHDHRIGILETPNDPYYPYQWGYPAMNAPAAWDTTVGAHLVKVAVVDTGIDLTHPDLQPNLCGPFTSEVPGEPTVQDGHGHGTHVSGTIAAASNNGLGVSGMSQSCLMGAKVLTRYGWGFESWVAAGIEWAADNGADVISMSLGGPDDSQAMHAAVQYAYLARGVLVVAAAGNSGCWGGDTVLYPARYAEVVAVAALDWPGDHAAWFSSCGPKVEVAAPGVSILSTLPGGYGWGSGTSMATPHVSGTAALMKASLLSAEGKVPLQALPPLPLLPTVPVPAPPVPLPVWPASLPTAPPALTGPALRCLLDLSTVDVGAPGRDVQTGWGRVDAKMAVDLGLDALLTGSPPDARTQAILTGCAQQAVAEAPPLPPLPVPLPPLAR